jgi:hypothetical protein
MRIPSAHDIQRAVFFDDLSGFTVNGFFHFCSFAEILFICDARKFSAKTAGLSIA